jgi:hypothetical protein
MAQSELTKGLLADMKARLDGLIEVGVAASPRFRDEFVDMIEALIEAKIADHEARSTEWAEVDSGR